VSRGVKRPVYAGLFYFPVRRRDGFSDFIGLSAVIYVPFLRLSRQVDLSII
jgi:hypothetical protein